MNRIERAICKEKCTDDYQEICSKKPCLHCVVLADEIYKLIRKNKNCLRLAEHIDKLFGKVDK